MPPRYRVRARKRVSRPATKRRGTPRPVPAHRTYTPELIEIIRHRYEDTPEPVITIGADLGIHPSSVHRMAKSRGWVRRNLAPPRGVSPALRLCEEARALEEGAGQGALRASAPLANASPALERPMPQRSLPPCGGGTGRGVATNAAVTPLPNPPPQGGREQTESAAGAAPEPSTIDRLERAILAELSTIEAMRAGLGPVPQKPRDAERTVRTLGLLVQTLQHLLRLRAALALGPHSDRGPNPYDDDIPADIDEFRRDLARRIDAFVASRTESGGADEAADASTLDDV